MLVSLSRLYATAGRNRVRRALTLIEPLAIVLIGGIIGTIILGIMLAITSTAEVPI
jgi:general secretion pathway protein F